MVFADWMILGTAFPIWFTLGVTVAILVLLVRNVAPPDLVFVGAVVVLVLFKVIDVKEAFAGFANPGVITVGMLFVVTAALQETGMLEAAGRRLLGRAKSPTGALGRLSVILLPLSAFLNNTPVVAMFVPIVINWCRRNEISPSKLLIPVSYLAILGGTCTLIGTSTNLVVQGLMVKNDIRGLSGQPGMSLFEIGLVGLPYAVVGTAYLAFFGQKLLPDRKELIETLGEQRREYLAEMLVAPGCRLVGQSVEVAGLRNLPGLFLIEIDRDGNSIAPVGPDDVIAAGDRLVFTGSSAASSNSSRFRASCPRPTRPTKSPPASSGSGCCARRS